jgi:hypothetical protein
MRLSEYKSWYIFGKFRVQIPAIMMISWFSSFPEGDCRDETSYYAMNAFRSVPHRSLFTCNSVLQIQAHAHAVKLTTN